jgi:hypothetical protein
MIVNKKLYGWAGRRIDSEIKLCGEEEEKIEAG